VTLQLKAACNGVMYLADWTHGLSWK